MISRRHLIGAMALAAAGELVARRAVAAPQAVIGFLNGGSADAFAHLVAAFLGGLREVGYVDGDNLNVEYRWADGQYEQLAPLAADLAQHGIAILVATGGGIAVSAAIGATRTVPIVFGTGSDPVKLGFVQSLNRPGGNVTGVTMLSTSLEGKRLGVLRDMLPENALIAVLLNPANTNFDVSLDEVQGAARSVGQPIHVLKASTTMEIGAAFDAASARGVHGLLVCADPFFYAERRRFSAEAKRHSLPALYEQREFVTAGGLASYGTSLVETYRQVGIYTGRVLKGEAPADLPVLQSSKFEFVINLGVARELGLRLSELLLARADEVIE